MTRQNTGLPKAVPPAWAPLLDGFTTALIAAGHPQTTIATRRSHLARMARQLRRPPQEVTHAVLIEWFGAQTWRPETRRCARASARVFFSWAQDAGILEQNPAAQLPGIKPTIAVTRPAPDAVWRTALIAATPRVTVMLKLAGLAGLRRAEIAQVHTDDVIDGMTGPSLVVRGKGDKQRIVPISSELADQLRRGAAGHTPGAPTTGWLFPGDDNGHLSPRWVGTLCAQVLPGAWTVHSLRHRFSCRAYRGSRNLRAVQQLLGHSSIAVTERYLAVNDDELRQAMLAAG